MSVLGVSRRDALANGAVEARFAPESFLHTLECWRGIGQPGKFVAGAGGRIGGCCAFALKFAEQGIFGRDRRSFHQLPGWIDGIGARGGFNLRGGLVEAADILNRDYRPADGGL
jgi:hypothetical protein